MELKKPQKMHSDIWKFSGLQGIWEIKISRGLHALFVFNNFYYIWSLAFWKKIDIIILPTNFPRPMSI